MSPTPAGQQDENPIRALLNAGGIPWQVPRSVLTERYGIRKHPAYWSEVLEIDTPLPIVEGLLWPLSAQVIPQYAWDLPATEFSGVSYFVDDAHENLRRTMDQLAARLGEPTITDSANTLGRCWTFGAAALTLTVWPPEMQRWPTVNPAEDRDPRLKTGCHISIKTGFRKSATEAELAWLRSFVPVAPVQVDRNTTANSAEGLPAPQHQLEFVRAPTAEMVGIFGFVGHSAGRDALIFWRDQLRLIPMADVIRFRVERILPAKGSGGSTLEVECRTNNPAFPTKRLTISSAEGVEDLNELAASLSAATGKPFELGEYSYDC